MSQAQLFYTRYIAITITTAMPANSGTATRRTSANGFVSVSVAHIKVTAATGDIVLPAADAIETIAPI